MRGTDDFHARNGVCTVAPDGCDLKTQYRATLEMMAELRIPALAIVLLSGIGLEPENVSAADAKRCAVLELYVRNNDSKCLAVQKVLQKYAANRDGVELRTYNLDDGGKTVERYQKVLKFFRIEKAEVPVVYSCRSVLVNVKPETLQQQVDAMLTITVFVRTGCPHCAAAKAFLNKIKSRYPGFRIVLHDVGTDPKALGQLQKLAERYRTIAASLPAIHFCNQLQTGYLNDETTGKRWESLLTQWTIACPKPPNRKTSSTTVGRSGFEFVSFEPDDGAAQTTPPISPGPVPNTDDQPPLPEDTSPPLPEGNDNPKSTGDPPPTASGPPDSIRVPLFGQLSSNRLGMPVFTFLIGLVDGFNPCAMWVLLFLLSVLVNLKSRAKILAVAGTFVVISGAAYYAFMAAWLNVFQLVGYLRWVQVTLGVLAVAIGSVHVKDFYAFKKGVTLSIPESAKPTIYARVRQVVTADNLLAAIIGASVLAILVNVVELLCTAGLPALYTEILTLQGYSAWRNYAYLGLYNLAYMFDDILMVSIVVITLDRHKLQEKQGRWLKLISGIAIALLGILMIVKPEWLI